MIGDLNKPNMGNGDLTNRYGMGSLDFLLIVKTFHLSELPLN